MPILPLVLFALVHRVMWSPPLTDNDVLLRQSLSGATEVRIWFYNNHEGIILRGQDVVNLINALRVQDETVENSNMGGGPSTDFDFY